MTENHSNDQPESGPSHNGLDLRDLNRRHISSIDKCYRMCAGAGSEITAFEHDTIYLAITVDDRQQPPFHEIAGKIARSWFHEKELKNAARYVAVIFQTNGRLGALINPKAKTPDQLADELINRMRPATKPEVPIAVISGAFRRIDQPEDGQ
jgi:hypothetical protein